MFFYEFCETLKNTVIILSTGFSWLSLMEVFMYTQLEMPRSILNKFWIRAWVVINLYLLQENQRVFPILLTSSSESDDYFPGQFTFTDSFETQGLYMYGCILVNSDKYSSSEVFTFFNSVNFILRSTVYKFRLWHFYDETCFIFKICFELFEFTWYILYKNALSRLLFWTWWR